MKFGNLRKTSDNLRKSSGDHRRPSEGFRGTSAIFGIPRNDRRQPLWVFVVLRTDFGNLRFNLHWLLHLNCTALSQSQCSNFFNCIVMIRVFSVVNHRSLYKKVVFCISVKRNRCGNMTRAPFSALACLNINS